MRCDASDGKEKRGVAVQISTTLRRATAALSVTAATVAAVAPAAAPAPFEATIAESATVAPTAMPAGFRVEGEGLGTARYLGPVTSRFSERASFTEERGRIDVREGRFTMTGEGADELHGPGGQPPGTPSRSARRRAARAADLGGQRGTIWVTNRTLNGVTVYAAASGAVLATIPVGREPNDVTVPPGSGKAYVTNEADNTVSVISTKTTAVVATVPVGPKPHHVETSLSGRWVAFGEFGTNGVGLIDTRSDALAEYPASANPAARTHQAYPTRDGRTLFATNEVGNELAAIDLRSGRLAFTVAVGQRPSEVVVTPDAKRAYVSLRGEDKVKLVDLASRAIRQEVVVGTQPDTLQLTPDGGTLVVALRGKPAQLAFVDTRSFTASAPVTIAGADTTAGHHSLSANGRFTFAAFEGPGAGVAVVDNKRRSVVATYADPGGGRPHGIHYADPAATSGPGIAVVSRSARVSRAGIAKIALRCGAESIVECRGRLTLRGRRGTKIGHDSFAIRAGRSATVRVKLGRRAFGSLARGGRLRARAVARARDRLGNTKQASRKITLRGAGQP